MDSLRAPEAAITITDNLPSRDDSAFEGTEQDMPAVKTSKKEKKTVCSRRSFMSEVSSAAAVILLAGKSSLASRPNEPQATGLPIFYKSAAKLACMIRSKQVSSVELVAAFLDRIQRGADNFSGVDEPLIGQRRFDHHL